MNKSIPDFNEVYTDSKGNTHKLTDTDREVAKSILDTPLDVSEEMKEFFNGPGIGGRLMAKRTGKIFDIKEPEVRCPCNYLKGDDTLGDTCPVCLDPSRNIKEE